MSEHSATGPQRFHVDSAESLPRELAPPDYLPVWSGRATVYEDELDDLDPGIWEIYFDGGSNNPPYVMADGWGDLYYVEQVPGGYEVNAANRRSVRFPNAYDAFYQAERWMAEAAGDL